MSSVITLKFLLSKQCFQVNIYVLKNRKEDANKILRANFTSSGEDCHDSTSIPSVGKPLIEQ